jgi:CRISPR-associated protein Cmr4
MGAAENEDRVVLEEYVFQPDADNRALAASFGEWFSTFALPQTDAAYVWWRTKLGKDLVVVSDDVFTYFVRMHTEIQTHVRIDPGTGTVDKRSGPRDEEALPPDTLLCTTVTIPTPLEGPARQAFPNGASDAATYLKGHLTRSFQLCGDRSLGKGVARPTVIDRGTARPSAGGGKQ